MSLGQLRKSYPRRSFTDRHETPLDSPEPTELDGPNWKALAIIVLVGLGLRCFYIHGQSVTYDEIYEMQLAQESVPFILAKADGFPPTYSLLLKTWQAIFGSDSGRALSVLFGLLTCIAMYFVGTAIGNRSVGIWSAALTAVFPGQLFYTSETRAYGLMLLAATGTIYFAVRILQANKLSNWLGFCFCCLIGVYTHYLFAILIGMSLILLLVELRSWQPIAAGFAIVAGILPLAILFAPSDFSMQNEWPFRMRFGLGQLAYTYSAFISGYTLGPSLRELHTMSLMDAVNSMLPWAMLMLAAFTALIMANRHGRRWPNKAERFLLGLALAPIVVGIFCNVTAIGYQVRYSIWAIIPITALLACLTASAVRHRTGQFGLALLVLLLGTAIHNRHSVDRYRNADLRAVARYLEQAPKHQLPVVVISSYMGVPTQYYLSAAWDVRHIATDTEHELRVENLRRLTGSGLTNGEDYWLLYTRQFHEDHDGAMFAYLNRDERLSLEKRFAGATLYRGVW